MFCLTETTTLTGTVDSGTLDFVATYADNNGIIFTEGSSDGTIGTNLTTLVSSPATGYRRLVRTISIFNAQGVFGPPITRTVTISINGLIICSVSISTGETLLIDSTIRIINILGDLKVGLPGLTGETGDIGPTGPKGEANTTPGANGENRDPTAYFGAGISDYTLDGITYYDGISLFNGRYIALGDIHANILYINSQELFMNGYRLFVKQYIEGNGTIHNNGTIGDSGGAPGGTGTIGGGGTGGTWGVGGTTYGDDMINSCGGNGGGGGAGFSSNDVGYVGGSAFPGPDPFNPSHTPAINIFATFPTFITGQYYPGNAFQNQTKITGGGGGGAGGAGGGDDGSTLTGGGGGGGGGVLIACVAGFSGNILFQANGGDGQNGTPTRSDHDDGAGGGGGGGGGGVAILVTRATSQSQMTGINIEANGGSGGNGGWGQYQGASSGPAVDGGTGINGNTVILYV
jgi:hypothetical protein